MSSQQFKAQCASRMDDRPMTNEVSQRSNGGGMDIPPLRINTSVPHYASFEEVPMSLPAPRHRDQMAEPKDERFLSYLMFLRGQTQSALVRTMDKRRRGVYSEEPERSEFLQEVDQEENKLWMKLEAIELLMKE